MAIEKLSDASKWLKSADDGSKSTSVTLCHFGQRNKKLPAGKQFFARYGGQIGGLSKTPAYSCLEMLKIVNKEDENKIINWN